MRTLLRAGPPARGRARRLPRRSASTVASWSSPTAVVAELRWPHGPRDGLVEIWNGVPFLSPLWARGPQITLVHHVHRTCGAWCSRRRLAPMRRVLRAHGRAAALPPHAGRHAVGVVAPGAHRLPALRSPTRSRVVPPGHRRPLHARRAEAARRPLVVTVGRLMPPKRFDELIRIAAEARASASPTCSSSSSATATSARPRGADRRPRRRATGSAWPATSPTTSCSTSTGGPGSSPARRSPRAGA